MFVAPQRAPGHDLIMRLSSLPWQIVCCVSIGLLVVACQDDSVDSDADGHAGSASTGGGSVGGAGGTGGQPSTGGTGMGGLGGDNSTGGTTSTQPLYPETLRGTGLYEAGSETLMPGVREFTPRFALYSDNASKRRFIWLPPGEPINTLDQDYWDFPVGTKLWKEFSRSGIRVETRYLEKLPSGAFVRIAYQWNDAQTDALPVPDGVQNASTTDHDIPSEEDCRLLSAVKR